MILHTPKPRPTPLRERPFCQRHPWAVPLVALEWPFEWLTYLLSHWSFLETLEYLSSFSVLVAVIFYFSESGDRIKQKHYQAWQVINTAQGKGGNGGRIDALQELDKDDVPLVGVDLAGAFLQSIRLPHARLSRANLNAVDARDAEFMRSDFNLANLHAGNFRQANFHDASLSNADLGDTDLCGANLSGASLDGATLDAADLGNVDLHDTRWQAIKSLKGANITGVRNAPTGFVDWALQHGAVSGRSSCQ